MSLDSGKGKFLYFASGKTEVTVRKDTLHRVIHEVNLYRRVTFTISNGHFQNKYQPHFGFVSFSSHAHNSRPTSLSDKIRGWWNRRDVSKTPSIWLARNLEAVSVWNTEMALTCTSSGERRTSVYWGHFWTQERNTRWAFHSNSMTPSPGYLRIIELFNLGGKSSARSLSSVLTLQENKEERSRSRGWTCS